VLCKKLIKEYRDKKLFTIDYIGQTFFGKKNLAAICYIFFIRAISMYILKNFYGHMKRIPLKKLKFYLYARVEEMQLIKFIYSSHLRGKRA
jgi:hypothetical protein